MKALEKFGKNKYLKFAVFAFMFVCWLLPFVDKANYLTYEIIGQISVAVLAFVFLIIFKEIFLVLEIVLLFPFIYSHSMTVDQIPYHLFVSIGIFLLGLLLHIIIYKQKPNKPKFLLGFIAVAVALARPDSATSAGLPLGMILCVTYLLGSFTSTPFSKVYSSGDVVVRF